MTRDKSKMVDAGPETEEEEVNGEGSVVLSITESGELVPVDADNQTQAQEVPSGEGNLLQQAFVEAAEQLEDGSTVIHSSQAVPEGTTVIQAESLEDGATAVLADGTTTVVRIATQREDGTTVVETAEQLEDGEQYTIADGNHIQARVVTAEELEAQNIRLVSAETGAEIQTVEGIIQTEEEEQQQPEQQHQQQQSVLKQQVTQLVDSGKKVTPPSTVKIIGDSSRAAPIGSSQNPIRIVQQGNQYTSVQQLDTDQLQQIIQVVQQQQQQVKEGGEPSQTVIFNPNNQTRIVYRVIYPSELHKTSPQQSENPSSKRHTIQIPKDLLTLDAGSVPRRQYRKRRADDEEKLDVPDLSREEKEAKKSTRPKTRFGRVSKPPKHMVKDYKHIHLVDWDEDHDDSDGGYSDFRASGSEDDAEDNAIREFYKKNIDSEYMHPGLTSTTKPRNYKCKKCDKAYIGQGGLARHFRMNPGHDVEGEGYSNVENEGEEPADENQEQNENSTNKPQNSEKPSGLEKKAVPPATQAPAPPRAVLKARQAYAQETTPVKRKGRLKELMRQCDDEELMEIVLPRLSKVITTYEYLLMRVERGRPLKPHIQDVLIEFEKLHKQVAKMCEDYLKPLQKADAAPTPGQNILQVTDNSIAHSLGLTTGAYEILDQPVQTHASFKYKLLTTEADSKMQNVSAKRSIEMVSPEQIIVSPAKKPRTENILKVTSEGLKVLAPDGKVTKNPTVQPTSQLQRTDSKLSSNITLLRSPGSNTSASGSANRVFVINPHANGSDSKAVVQTIDATVQNSTGTNSSIDVDSNTVKVVAQESEGAVQLATSTVEITNDGETSESNLANETIQENSETIETETIEGDNVEIQVVSVSAPDSGGGGDDGAEVIQQDILPGQILQVRDTDGRILHVTAGENGELIQVETDENGVPLQESEQTTQVVTQQAQTQGEEAGQQAVEAQAVEAQPDLYQTEDGVIFIQNSDGTIQVHGHSDQPIPLETVQALLAMESEGQIVEQ